MYKQSNKNGLKSRVLKRSFRWIKRKMFLIISALMIGMSNAIYEEDNTINRSPYKIQKKHNKE